VINLIGHYEISPAVEIFGEAKYANIMAYSLAQPTFDYYMFIPSDNPYMPTSIRNAVDPSLGGVLVTRDNFDLGQRGERIKRETFRSVIGARGELGGGFRYEVSYVHGQTAIVNHFVNDRYTDRWNAAIDVVTDPTTGQPTCRVNVDPTAAVTTTFKAGECVPFNVFGEGNSSAAALNFLRANTTEHSKITQDVVSGQLTGDTHSFFMLPGGPVGFAVGGEYRKETSRFTPDPLEQQGLTFSNKLLPSYGKYDVKEVFGELDLPIAKDVPFIKSLDISGAVRYSNYSTIGSTTAWKVDATWAPISDIRFRGTISTAVRAPNIGELFGAASQTYAFFDDPCAVANRSLGKAPALQTAPPCCSKQACRPIKSQSSQATVLSRSPAFRAATAICKRKRRKPGRLAWSCNPASSVVSRFRSTGTTSRSTRRSTRSMPSSLPNSALTSRRSITSSARPSPARTGPGDRRLHGEAAERCQFQDLWP
jgi:hypothetical protein